jgi:pyruvate formate lyase activating enzyme
MEKEAILYRKLGDNRVECLACARLCKIPEGSHGFCFVRQNHGGRLYLETYGLVEAVQVDPIEKKPFNHFMPGTSVFGIGTSSCNWGCLFCQNHNISKEREIKGREMTPEEVVEMAIAYDTQSIAYTYNEPSIFIEYALDIAKLARRKGLKNLWVTNGYMTKEAVRAMKGLIDAVVVDYKGSGEMKFANKYEAVVSNEPIKEAMLEIRRAGIHLEMTDLVIPKVGDSLTACDTLTKWIRENLGAETPIQFIAFHPDYKMLDYPVTPYATLKKHYDIAQKNDLDYVYIGNAPGNPYEDTYCPRCRSMVVDRLGFDIAAWNLTDEMKCANCGYRIFMAGGKPNRSTRRQITALY